MQALSFSSSLAPRGVFASNTRVRASCARLSIMAKVKPGDQLPDVVLTEGAPDYGKGTDVKLRDLFKGKKGILFAVPGAFTPGCSKTHLPSYIADAAKLKAKGIEVVVCTATNDAFVMAAWGQAQGAGGKVMMLADPKADLAKALGVEKQSGALTRSGRYSMLVEDNVVKAFNDADEGGGMECTLSNVIYDAL